MSVSMHVLMSLYGTWQVFPSHSPECEESNRTKMPLLCFPRPSEDPQQKLE